MTIYFIPSTNGFWDSIISPDIPEGAIEITEEKRQELLSSKQETGGTIEYDSVSNLPVVVPDAIATLSELQLRVDKAADAARQAIVVDPVRALEYEKAAADAQMFVDLEYPNDNIPRSVSAWAIDGRSPRDAADSILAEAANYNNALYTLRETRLAIKSQLASLYNSGNVSSALLLADATVNMIEQSVAGIGNNK